MSSHDYTVDISWSGERKGMMCSPEINKPLTTNQGCIDIATPPQFAKGIEGIWSPEHLFTASVSSCFMTTFLAIAENSKLEFSDFKCKSKGRLEQVEGKFMMTEVHLFPVVTIANENDRSKAERVLAKTEGACLITNSIKSKVVVTPSVVAGKFGL